MAETGAGPKSHCENTALTSPRNNDDDDDDGDFQKIELEFILLQPHVFIGSVEPITQKMWVFDADVGLNCREVTHVPGLVKIFDEILVNAVENKQRDSSTDCITITIDPEKNSIRIWNNGKGVPVVEHQVEKVFIPTLMFGQLISSSCDDDDGDEQQKITGGGNGYGAKLCNIFSTKFTVKTGCSESKSSFKQTWFENMSRAGEVKIKPFSGNDYTCITFHPDLSRFQMQSLDRDTVALMTRRAYDVAGSCPGIQVFLNGTRLPVDGFRSYVDLYLKDKVDETGSPLTVVHEVVNPHWEVCLTISEQGFQQVSLVNSIATTKGGTHIDYVTDHIVSKLIEVLKKKNKAAEDLQPFQVKNLMWLFVNCLIQNPTFDSQTKENMTLHQQSFTSDFSLSHNFFNQASGCEFVKSVENRVKFTSETQLSETSPAVNHTKIRGVTRAYDAKDAGGENSAGCTLILTKGDGAKALAVSGLDVVGRDLYGVFPLRGKMLSERNESHDQMKENSDISDLMKILGLQYDENYSDPDSLRSLRYGKVLMMTNRDLYGSRYRGLIINFFHHNWPSLLQHSFLEEFLPPIVKASCKNQELSFYSIPEFTEWKEQQISLKSWKIKHCKGLGSCTAKEIREYFRNLERHRVPLKYTGPADDEAIVMFYSKEKVNERMERISRFTINRRQLREKNLPEENLYSKETSSLTYQDFINKELVPTPHYWWLHIIPCLVDGLKLVQRKVLFCCFKRKDKREVTVSQLAASAAEMSAYHTGEVSLETTIVDMAQNFVGSNNLNLLQPLGQFGTRLLGGQDSAGARFLFTALSSLTRLLFPSVDDVLLNYSYHDGVRVEPEWYVPIIPLVLVNGVDAFGKTWESRLPNYDVREIIQNIHRMLDGEEPLPMLPSYKGFRGTVEELEENQYMISGEVEILDSTTIVISELPVKSWTESYKEQVLEEMLNGSEEKPALITDYEEQHTDTTVRFVVKMTEEKLQAAATAGLHKVFRLQNRLNYNSMVLYDDLGCLKRYEFVQDILKDFFNLRLKFYVLRRNWLLGMLGAESSKLNNQIRFILMMMKGPLAGNNRKEMIITLQQMGYDSDPVKVWKRAQKKGVEEESGEEDDEKEEEEEEEGSSGPDYKYLLNMPLWSLSPEKMEELCRQSDVKITELKMLEEREAADLWREDLAAFIEELEVKLQQQEEEEEEERVEQEEEESQLTLTQVQGRGGGAEEVKRKNWTRPTPQDRVTVKNRSSEKSDGERDTVRAESEGSVKVMKMMELEEEEAGESVETGLAAPLTKKAKKRPRKKKGFRKRKAPEDCEIIAVPNRAESSGQPPAKKKKKQNQKKKQQQNQKKKQQQNLKKKQQQNQKKKQQQNQKKKQQQNQKRSSSRIKKEAAAESKKEAAAESKKKQQQNQKKKQQQNQKKQEEEESQLQESQVQWRGGGAEEVKRKNWTRPTSQDRVTVKNRSSEKSDGERDAVRAESEGSVKVMMMMELKEEEAGESVETGLAAPLTKKAKKRPRKKKGFRKRKAPEECEIIAVPNRAESSGQPPAKKKKKKQNQKKKQQQNQKKKQQQNLKKL